MLRVGLVGWGASTGNGGMNHDIARLAPWITSWLCPKHPSFGWHEPYLEAVSDKVKVIRCHREGDVETYERFLDDVNAVLFIEHPYLRNYELVERCKIRGIMTVCIPMWEWWPERNSWSQKVDMIWCVTQYTRQYFEILAKYLKNRHDRCDWADKIYGNSWGVELDEFKFTLRKQAKRFLFANGNGGGGALRKGSSIIAEAAAYIPNIEIIMLTQGDNYVKPMPENVKIIQRNFPTKTEIYENGDIFIVPTHWEGLGHGLYEAQACGLPVITTDAPPMDECGAEWLIPISHSEQYKLSGKPIPKVFANAKKLSELIYKIQNDDISDKSVKARKYIENNNEIKSVIKNLEEAIQQSIILFSQSFSQQEIEKQLSNNYEQLVELAWNAYRNKNEKAMIQLLLQSLEYSPLLKTETILDWLERFENLCLKNDNQLKCKAIATSKAWDRLIKLSDTWITKNFETKL